MPLLRATSDRAKLSRTEKRATEKRWGENVAGGENRFGGYSGASMRARRRTKNAAGTYLRALDAAGGERLHKCPDPPGAAPDCSPLGRRQEPPERRGRECTRYARHRRDRTLARSVSG